MVDDKKKKKGAEKAKTDSVKHTVCDTIQEMMKKAAKDGISTCFDWVEAIKPYPLETSSG